jgi:predicted Ser/Thr protein kinase
MSPKDPPDPTPNPFETPPDTLVTPPAGVPQIDDRRRTTPRAATNPPSTTSPQLRPWSAGNLFEGSDHDDTTLRPPSRAPTPPAGTRPKPEPPSRAATPPAGTRPRRTSTPPPVRPKSPTTPPRRPSFAEPARAGSIITDDPTKMSGKYVFGEALGRGGMGEVMLAHDRQIGRDVAVKRLRTGSPTEDETSRFLREARIQARLDHPAIVPVYELSKDELGRPYFAMKRVAGRTLTQVLEVGTRQRLLRAFADVCRAVDFAHSRGIVHRDLKPANIVLGEFGEVYVLDWGVARVLEDAGFVVGDVDTIEGSAPADQTLGTPGYMAPEQLDDPDVTRAADIYSLGAILFEILAGDPFHPPSQAIESTRASTLSTSPAARRPDRAIPPELDALCSVMLSRKPSVRPTARWSADRIEEYLDGDRDIASRRAMANEMVWSARAAFDSGRRPDAMRTASRALALDPQAPGAAELVTTLLLDPPKTPPEELREALRSSDAVYISHHAKAAIPGYLLIALFMPLVIFNGILDWGILVATIASALGMAVAARQLVRRPDRSFAWMVAYAIGNSLVLILLGRLGGAFTFVPALVSYITASVITYPAFLERSWVLIGIMVTGFLLPFGLEVSGVLERTWEIQHDGILVRGNAMDLGGPSALVTVLAASAATVLMAGIQCAKLGRANREAQHKLVTLAWHLRQLLPTSSPSPGRSSG